jgi:signal peptidase I
MRIPLAPLREPVSTLRVIIQPLAIALVLAFAVRASRVGIYSIPSASMHPTLQAGDTIIVTPYADGEQPEHGDVVVFRSPAVRDQMIVKRVIATAGDVIEARDGRVLLRGHTLPETYATQAPTAAFNGLIVPSGSFFVLGDNRPNSFDSRQWGVIPREAIVGRARVVLWSSHLATPAHASAPPSTSDSVVRASHGLRLFKLVR